jgi:hypothetical protein
MRYRRQQQKNGLIKELAHIFGQLPNHSAQCTNVGYYLQYWDAMEGRTQIWDQSDLNSMSITELKALLSKKRWVLAGSTLINFFKKK